MIFDLSVVWLFMEMGQLPVLSYRHLAVVIDATATFSQNEVAKIFI